MGKPKRVKVDNQNCEMKHNLLTVCYDPGGAEVLGSYLRHKRDEYGTLWCVAQGLAKRIFQRKGLQKYLIEAKRARRLILKRKVDLLLSSTSRTSNLEIDFIRLAKQNSIATIAILEHWINYKERFGYPCQNWRRNLPQELWVMDDLAKKIAQRELGKTVMIKLKPNFYFKDLKAEYSNTITSKSRGYFNILFLNEPILGPINFKDKRVKIVTQIKKIKRLINFIKSRDYQRPICFTLRHHPIERPLAYAGFVRDNSGSRNLRVVLSNSNRNSLIKDIKNSDVVMGIKSSALAIASLFKNTIGYCDRPPVWFSAYRIKYVGSNMEGLEHLLFGRSK